MHQSINTSLPSLESTKSWYVSLRYIFDDHSNNHDTVIWIYPGFGPREITDWSPEINPCLLLGDYSTHMSGMQENFQFHCLVLIAAEMVFNQIVPTVTWGWTLFMSNEGELLQKWTNPTQWNAMWCVSRDWTQMY